MTSGRSRGMKECSWHGVRHKRAGVEIGKLREAAPSSGPCEHLLALPPAVHPPHVLVRDPGHSGAPRLPPVPQASTHLLNSSWPLFAPFRTPHPPARPSCPASSRRRPDSPLPTPRPSLQAHRASDAPVTALPCQAACRLHRGPFPSSPRAGQRVLGSETPAGPQAPLLRS